MRNGKRIPSYWCRYRLDFKTVRTSCYAAGMADAIERFSGFGEGYDSARPRPPAELVEVLTRWSGVDAPDVVDLGAGTGLSVGIWVGVARSVTAVEPSADMRAVATERLAGLAGLAEPVGPAGPTALTLVDATAEATGLPDGCADLVTASQALHWFDPARALPEAARLLRPGGVFAAYDCDWPPCVDAETDAAYTEFERLRGEREDRQGTQPARAEKSGHLRRLRESGLFRFATEVCLHSRDTGDADRLVAVALSQGGAQALLRAGVPESEFGLDRLREVAARRLPTARPWWWTYRVRLAVR
jgi:SAM-dependent methyltransferase